MSQEHPLTWEHGPKPDLTVHTLPLKRCPRCAGIQPEQLRPKLRCECVNCHPSLAGGVDVSLHAAWDQQETPRLS